MSEIISATRVVSFPDCHSEDGGSMPLQRELFDELREIGSGPPKKN